MHSWAYAHFLVAVMLAGCFTYGTPQAWFFSVHTLLHHAVPDLRLPKHCPLWYLWTNHLGRSYQTPLFLFSLKMLYILDFFNSKNASYMHTLRLLSINRSLSYHSGLRTPQDWLTFYPRCFLVSDWSSSFRAFAVEPLIRLVSNFVATIIIRHHVSH